MPAILAAFGCAGQYWRMTGFRDVYRMTVRGRKWLFIYTRLHPTAGLPGRGDVMPAQANSNLFL